MPGKDRSALHEIAERTKPQWQRKTFDQEESIAAHKARQEAAARELHDRVRPHTCGAWKNLPKHKGE